MDRKAIVEHVVTFKNRADVRSILKEVSKQKGLTQFHDLIRAADQSVSTDEFLLYIAYKRAKAKQNHWWNSFEPLLRDFIEKDLKTLSTDELSKAMGYLMWAANAVSKEN